MEPEHNDYAMACTAILFVLEQAWPAFTAWNESQTGMTAPRSEARAALAAFDRQFLLTRKD